MLPYLYSNALTDLLFEKSDDFVGIYDLSAERFIQVNQAGVQLLGFDSERELLIDPVRSRSLRLPPLEDEHRTALVARIRAVGQHEETAQIGRLAGQPFWGQLMFSQFVSHNHQYAWYELSIRSNYIGPNGHWITASGATKPSFLTQPSASLFATRRGISCQQIS